MRFFLLAAVLVVLVGGYTAYWFTLASATRQGVETWREQARAQGTLLQYRNLAVGGYPFRVTAVMEGASLRMQGPEGSITLSSPKVQAVAQTWRPNHVLGRSEGPLRIDWTLPDGSPALSATAAEAEASLLVGGDGMLARGAMDLHAIAGESADGEAFSAARAQLHLRQAARMEAGPAANGAPTAQEMAVPARYDGALRIAELVLPEGAVPPELGPRIETLDIAATLRGTWPPGPFPAALAAWRDGGGVLDVAELRLAWGPVTLVSDGSVTVDQAMRPLGAFTLRLGGHEALLDAVAANRDVDRGQVAMARLLLGGLAQHDGEGRSFVQVPLSAQDGRLFLGPIAVLPLPPLLP